MVVVSGWTPTNIDPRRVNADSIIKVDGLTELIVQKISTDTYCNLNVFSGNSKSIAPNGFDRYVLGFWFEVFDENHFLELYHANPQAEFVILSDMRPNDIVGFERCKFLQLYHWNWFLEQAPQQLDTGVKSYKISSLSNRVNEFRCFITAKLLDMPDALFTWNAQYLEDGHYNYIFAPAGWPLRDNLLPKLELLRNPINAQSFSNDPGNNLATSSSNQAYCQSLVNCINETKDNSWHENFGLLPGPYITEKTWKPLCNGNALIFSGQYGIQSVLEQFGFRFDYPWSAIWADCPGDLERLDRLLALIDTIGAMSLQEIQTGIEPSVQHNRNLISSGLIQKRIQQLNADGLDLLTTIL